MESDYPAAALTVLGELLQGCGSVWVIGGSTSLAVRGGVLSSPPRDLDIYADQQDIPNLHERLTRYALDEPAESATAQYRSTLSHYSVKGTTVELVGGFHISAADSLYRTEVRQVLHPNGETFAVHGRGVRLVPLAHELLFNVMREREDRAELIGALIRVQPDRHLTILDRLLSRNEISKEIEQRVRRFTAYDGIGLKAGMQ